MILKLQRLGKGHVKDFILELVKKELDIIVIMKEKKKKYNLLFKKLK